MRFNDTKLMILKTQWSQINWYHTPGIDGVVCITDKEKIEAMNGLETVGYKATALKRIYIEKYCK